MVKILTGSMQIKPLSHYLHYSKLRTFSRHIQYFEDYVGYINISIQSVKNKMKYTL